MLSTRIIPLLFMACHVFGAYAPNLPFDEGQDRLLLRLSTKYGTLLPARFYLRPYTFSDISSYYRMADSLSDGPALSTTEKMLLRKARDRYGPDKALVKWKKKNEDIRLKVNCNLLGNVRPGYDDSGKVQLFGIASPSLAGNLGKFSFYSGISVWTEYRSDTLFSPSSYQPYDGVAYNLYGRGTESASIRSSDLPHGGIRYDAGRIEIETAIDYLRSGPALFFPVTLSGAAPPVTYLRGSVDLAVVDYSHVIGLLKGQKDKSRYIYMHRLSTNLWTQRIHLGINEVIIYGNTTDEPHSDTNTITEPYRQSDRTVEWVYCIPFLPFKFLEHYAGDRDNAALSFDLSVRWPAGWRWYGEFFLDDMLSPWKLFSDDWGNKWAFTAGVNYFGECAGRDITVIAEYSRVEPWVYTHFSGGSHRYTHFDQGLGSPLGPNSQAALLSFFMQVAARHELGLGIRHTAWNHTVRGGNITDIFQFEDPEDPTKYSDNPVKTFLGPGTEWYLQPVLYWNFNLFGRFAFRSSCTVDLLDMRGRMLLAVSGGLYF